MPIPGTTFPFVIIVCFANGVPSLEFGRSSTLPTQRKEEQLVMPLPGLIFPHFVLNKTTSQLWSNIGNARSTLANVAQILVNQYQFQPIFAVSPWDAHFLDGSPGRRRCDGYPMMLLSGLTFHFDVFVLLPNAVRKP